MDVFLPPTAFDSPPMDAAEDLPREQLLEELKRLRDRVAELEASEAELRLSEEKYRMLIEACPDAVVVADLQLRVVFASHHAVRLWGADSAEEICGRELISFVADEERPKAAAVAAKIFEIDFRRDVEYTFLRKNGERFPVEVSNAVVRDAAGRPRALVSIVRDISERKSAQEALQREHRALEHLLQSSDHERQLIAYEIHDGLAQDLAGAIMQFQVFDQLKDGNAAGAAEVYNRGITLLRQSHFEARRLIAGVRPPVLDESGVVEAITHLVHEQASDRGPRVEFRTDVRFDRLPSALENAIYRITQEGLANACQHSRSERVRIHLRHSDGRIQIDIRDWGVGFDVQAIQGNRFGLEGIRERARLLGGLCRIQSAPGRGTRVRVELPLPE